MISFGLLFFICSAALLAQDVHFSQFLNAPLQLNPAQTANSEWDIRAGINWRQQWVKVPVNYQTFGAFTDYKLTLKQLNNAYLGLGMNLIHDEVGDSELSWSQVGLKAAVHWPANDETLLSFGWGLDVGQRAFSKNQLQFADQYNGEFFDPDQSTAEQFASTSAAYFSHHLGLNVVRSVYQSRSEFVAGVSVAHLNRPNIVFYDDSQSELPSLFKAHLNAYLEVDDDWDLSLLSFAALQGNYQEILLGAGARYHLDYQEEKIALGANVLHRFNDAFIIQLEAAYQQWKAGISYDINVSDFNKATRSRGGLELSLQYYLAKAKPPDEFKSCPIF